MAVFKCKMCGGDLEVTQGLSVAECQYCGTRQTLPKLDDEQKANLYDRANHFRRNNEYDKAMGIYEQILNKDSKDAEAYWSLVLCRYGVEYVEDPSTHKRIPTVNRTQFVSIFDDEDYKSALKYADEYQKSIYEKEAEGINEIQKGILKISSKEEPFDVFICYKETDQNGKRTQDSVLANDLYHQLVQEGFKVFFSRITLEDKLGVAYEPYIFAALNSAKVMVVIGTKPEYFNAVWVKNEWSRYLALVKNSGGSKVLIPAYRGMSPYDLPEEFSHLQAQDMEKLGFMQDLIRGIRKIISADKSKTTIKETVVMNGNADIAPLLKRVFLFLEDGDFESANEYCERVLDIDPECADAYLGKLMAKNLVHKQEQLADCKEPFDDDTDYQKIMRFGDSGLKNTLVGYNERIKERNEAARKEEIYANAVQEMETATFRLNYQAAVAKFAEIPGYKDADERMEFCKQRIDEIILQEEEQRLRLVRKEKLKKRIIGITVAVLCVGSVITIILVTVLPPLQKYNQAISCMQSDTMRAVRIFDELGDYKDVEQKLAECRALMPGARNMVAAGYGYAVGIQTDGTVMAVESYSDGGFDMGQGNVEDWKGIISVVSGGFHTVGLKSDGTVVITPEFPLFEQGDDISHKKRKNQTHLSEWKDIVSVSTSATHVVGLRTDGTAVAYGNNDNNQCEVGNWEDIISITVGSGYTIGLKSDGTVVATGELPVSQSVVDELKDIVAISTSDYHLVGLKANGTVIAFGINYYNQCNVEEWEDIVSILATEDATYGLRSDGMVVCTADWDNAAKWRNVVSLSTNGLIAVGLKMDKTVATNFLELQDAIEGWQDIVSVAIGSDYIIGRKSNGEIITEEFEFHFN